MSGLTSASSWPLHSSSLGSSRHLEARAELGMCRGTRKPEDPQRHPPRGPGWASPPKVNSAALSSLHGRRIRGTRSPSGISLVFGKLSIAQSSSAKGETEAEFGREVPCASQQKGWLRHQPPSGSVQHLSNHSWLWLLSQLIPSLSGARGSRAGGTGTRPALVGTETSPFKGWGLKPP